MATLLLTGVAISALLGAASSFLISLTWVRWEIAQEIIFWLMGGLDNRRWTHCLLLLPCVVVGLSVALAYRRELDLLQAGEETALALLEQARRDGPLLVRLDDVDTALKVALDGSVSGGREHLLIYATSNRRHLLPEYQEENALTRHVGEEIHFAEAVEEKIALSERFGLWLAFHAFDQERYLSITQHWLARLGCERPVDHWREEALRWALTRGSRSGRAAYQFARDYAGRLALGEPA